jgi:type IV pilus assembly protein PilM
LATMVMTMLSLSSKHRGPLIGLDIGSHAVRAAELTVKGGQTTLRRFAQVELPDGAVADGEVVDATVVGKALKRLWAEGKFSHRRPVVGVSSQRAIVRLADVPAMTDGELKTALKFEAGDLIPIPVEDAVLDFSTVDSRLPQADPSEPVKMRILLAAAQRDMVNSHLEALKLAGLSPVAVDPVALALLRGIPVAAEGPPAADGSAASITEAVVAIGASNTTVAIRANGTARFVRVLNVGGDDLTSASDSSSIADNPSSPAQFGAGGTSTVATTSVVRAASGGPLRAIVDDIRGSLDFYLAQSDAGRVDRIVLTGGGALADGLLPRLQEALRHTVEIANPLSTVAVGKTGLTDEQLREAAPYLVTAIGLALWATVPGRPISLLPDEVLLAKRQSRQTSALAFAVAAFAAALGVLWAGRTVQVTRAQHDASQAQAKVASLNREIASISDVTSLQAQVKGQQLVYASALSKEVDWIRLIGQVSAIMPKDMHLTSLNVQRLAAAAGTSAAPTPDGKFSIAAVAGNPDSVANWLRAVAKLPALDGTLVQTITASPGQPGVTAGSVVFQSTSSVTSVAESERSLTAGKAK